MSEDIRHQTEDALDVSENIKTTLIVYKVSFIYQILSQTLTINFLPFRILLWRRPKKKKICPKLLIV